MKLKLIVASLSVAGLISFPVFADTAGDNGSALTKASTKHHKHKHHHHHKASSENAHQPTMDYKDSGAMVQPVTQSQQDVTAMSSKGDQMQAVVDAMNQRADRAVATPTWFNNVLISGGVNVDGNLGGSKARNQDYTGENNSRASLNDAYVNVKGNVGDWVSGVLSISYNSVEANQAGVAPVMTMRPAGNYYLDNSQAPYQNDTLNLEEAYVRIANFNESPVYAELGRQYIEFNHYNTHPIIRSLDQVLSESNQTVGEIGVVTPQGFHASLYGFDNQLANDSNEDNGNFGLGVGYSQDMDQMKFDVGAGYLYNMAGGVSDVTASINTVHSSFGNPTGMYYSVVGGGALWGKVQSGPFGLKANYVSAMSDFDVRDLPYINGATLAGAKPWAFGIQGDYGFNAIGKQHDVYLGYQKGHDMVALATPKDRVLVGYNVGIVKNADVGLEYAHDQDYDTNEGGTGNKSNVVAVRLGVKFG